MENGLVCLALRSEVVRDDEEDANFVPGFHCDINITGTLECVHLLMIKVIVFS